MFFLGAIMAIVISHTALATEIHTWTDNNGVVNFSDMKPASGESQIIVMRGESTQTLTIAEQHREDMDEELASFQHEQAVIEEMCKQHGERLERMGTATQVSYEDENGQEIGLEDDQRAVLMEESRNYLAENCN